MRSVDLQFNAGIDGFQAGLALGEIIHRLEILPDGEPKKDVFKHDPGGVLQPSPMTRSQHPEDGFGPEDAPQEMVEAHDHSGGQQDPPVAIERDEGERSEHMEVGFDAAPGEVNEERGKQHLSDDDGVAGERCPR